MKLMLDLNVLLDVVQQRQPHYAASAQVLDFALVNQCGSIAAHLLTTLHYLVAKYGNSKQADELIDWLLQNFTIVPATKATFPSSDPMFSLPIEVAGRSHPDITRAAEVVQIVDG